MRNATQWHIQRTNIGGAKVKMLCQIPRMGDPANITPTSIRMAPLFSNRLWGGGVDRCSLAFVLILLQIRRKNPLMRVISVFCRFKILQSQRSCRHQYENGNDCRTEGKSWCCWWLMLSLNRRSIRAWTLAIVWRGRGNRDEKRVSPFFARKIDENRARCIYHFFISPKNKVFASSTDRIFLIGWT